MRLALALAVLASAVAITSSCKQHVDTQDFESRIRARVAELGAAAERRDVPQGRRGQAGRDVRVRRGDRRQDLRAERTIDDATASGDSAEIDMSTKWKRGEAVVAARLAPAMSAAMTKSIGAPVTVSCGEPLASSPPIARCAAI